MNLSKLISKYQFRYHFYNMDVLPDEIVVIITSYLDVKSITRLAQTNSRLYQICQESTIWRPRCYAELPLTLGALDYAIASGRSWYQLYREGKWSPVMVWPDFHAIYHLIQNEIGEPIKFWDEEIKRIKDRIDEPYFHYNEKFHPVWRFDFVILSEDTIAQRVQSILQYHGWISKIRHEYSKKYSVCILQCEGTFIQIESGAWIWTCYRVTPQKTDHT